MKELSPGVFQCFHCSKQYKNPALAGACERSHNIIFVPLERKDLMALINFIYTKDEKCLNEKLVKTLTKYSRTKVEENVDDLSYMQE